MNTGSGNDEKDPRAGKTSVLVHGVNVSHRAQNNVPSLQKARGMNNHYFDWSKNIESFSPASSFDVYLTQPDGYESIK
jgi:hypothetical protein